MSNEVVEIDTEKRKKMLLQALRIIQEKEKSGTTKSSALQKIADMIKAEVKNEN
ncbi:MAG: hypothetical protein R3Y60_04955 [bacterium]